MNDYVERLCPVEMPEEWKWVMLIEELKEREKEERIREALEHVGSKIVRFATEKGKLDCRLKRMNERAPRKLTAGDVKRAAQLLDEAWSGPPFTSGLFLAALLEDVYYRIPEGGAENE